MKDEKILNDMWKRFEQTGAIMDYVDFKTAERQIAQKTKDMENGKHNNNKSNRAKSNTLSR